MAPLQVDIILPNNIETLFKSDLEMPEESNTSKSLYTIEDICFQLDLAWCISESVPTLNYFRTQPIKRILVKIWSLICRVMPRIIRCQFSRKAFIQSPPKLLENIKVLYDDNLTSSHLTLEWQAPLVPTTTRSPGAHS